MKESISKKDFIKLIPKNSIKYKLYASGDFIILKCNCGSDNCLGWAFVKNDNESIRIHRELYS